MKVNVKPLPFPLDTIIFDCDGTLTSVEGIDVLAERHGSGDVVKKLTSDAMGKVGINPDLYKKRLDLVNPTQESIYLLTQCYIENCVADAFDVIQLLKRLKKSIYIVSAGLYPAVAGFGEYLKIPSKNIFAVGIQFDEHGNFIDYDYSSPLIDGSGKRAVVTEIKKTNPSIAFIGDGLNDLVTKDLVSRFIGFGGIYYRKNIEEQCSYYIKSPSMSSLLPLVLTHQEIQALEVSEKSLFEKGLAAIQAGHVLIQEGT